MRKMFRIRNILFVLAMIGTIGIAYGMTRHHYERPKPVVVQQKPVVGASSVAIITQMVTLAEYAKTTIDAQIYARKQIRCLARNIYFEARGESEAGQLAVGMVTINRVESSLFPNSICGVVHQSVRYADGSPKINRCQFSWYCDGKADMIRNDKLYQQIYLMSVDLYVNYYQHRLIPDIVGGATYYHNTTVSPRWRNTSMTTKIDNHIFYRMKEIGNRKDAVASAF